MDVRPHYELRKATLSDRVALERLIARSARQLGMRDYSAAQIEAALRGAFGVDTQLIEDGTYFVVEHEGGIVGCGGWSRRPTLFGGDNHAGRSAAELDPAIDAARIRAFFVDPEHERRGIGTAILNRCEEEARSHGFSRLELMATLPGVRLYAERGYESDAPVHYELAPGLTIEFVPMRKTLDIAVRRADERDLPEILRLYSQPDVDGERVLPLEAARAIFRRMAAHPSYAVYVAEREGRIVGTFELLVMENLAHRGTPSAVVEDVVVEEGQRRSGVGRAMMRFAMERARERGCYKLALSSNLRRAGAHEFYRRLGFEQHGLSFRIAP